MRACVCGYVYVKNIRRLSTGSMFGIISHLMNFLFLNQQATEQFRTTAKDIVTKNQSPVNCQSFVEKPGSFQND